MLGCSPFSWQGQLDRPRGAMVYLDIGNIMNQPLIEYHRPPGLHGVELLHLTDQSFSFAPHMHDAYVFWFNGQGGERVSLCGSSDILQPDSFGVVAPGEVHANHAVTEYRTLESLYVDQGVVDDVARQTGNSGAEFRSRLQKDRHSRRALARLHRTLMTEEDPFGVREIFLRVFGFLLNRHGETASCSIRHREPDKVHRARAIIADRFADSLDLDELAHECGCSACHLIRLFRRETGMTPHAYLMETRLLQAKELLAGKRPVTDVALDTGFTDQSHLNRRFKARYGLTPGQYRQQVFF